MANVMLTATGAAIGMLERILKAHVHVEGIENLTNHPTLFVVNHFTRLETFLVPYVLHKYNGMAVRSLAHSSLFHGRFGKYLESMGALPSSKRLRNREILKGLLTGESNWVIYPEGLMVKNKDVYEHGQFRLTTPTHTGPPHSGAALLAIRSELLRHDIIHAGETSNSELMQHYLTRYRLDSIDEVSPLQTMVTPVNITYYPIRPGHNFLSDLAAMLFKNIPERLDEELQTEGSLLLSPSDITFYFGKPISISEQVESVLNLYRKYPAIARAIPRDYAAIGLKRRRLTEIFMDRIYTKTAINIDNLFCMALRRIKRRSIREDSFKRAIYLSAVQIGKLEGRRIHNSLRENFIEIITGEHYEPYEDIRDLAIKEGVIELRDGVIHIDRNLIQRRDFEFHDIRLKHIVSVLANELAPLPKVVRILDYNVNSRDRDLSGRIVSVLSESDLERFESDYTKYYDEELSKPREVGSPFFLRSAKRELGIVLSHGYLAAPEEVRPLARSLHEMGWPVYVPRLKGMGTAPVQMNDVTWEEWYQSFARGYAIMKHYCKKVVLGGFSAGGLLALLYAARNPSDIECVFSISAPLKLNDNRNMFVPAGIMWNDMLEQFHIEHDSMEYVEHKSENPHINYSHNYLRGIQELKGLMSAVQKELKNVTNPTLLIQATDDPAVRPESADMIHTQLGAEHKQIIMLDFDRHTIIQNEGRELVFDAIRTYISNCARTHQPKPTPAPVL